MTGLAPALAPRRSAPGLAPPRVAVVFISDRPRDLYLDTAMATFREQVTANSPEVNWVGAEVIDDRAHRLGMAGAVRAAWQWARRTDAQYLWHVEEDFRFVRPVDTARIVDVLRRSSYLASMTLTRGPWSTPERRAGGIVLANPGPYRRMSGMDGARWEHHRVLFSLNPSLIPWRTFGRWPDVYPGGELGVGNEAGATKRLLEAGQSFGLWGQRDDPPYCEHLGEQRGDGWHLGAETEDQRAGQA